MKQRDFSEYNHTYHSYKNIKVPDIYFQPYNKFSEQHQLMLMKKNTCFCKKFDQVTHGFQPYMTQHDFLKLQKERETRK